jgi:hypothetical protein
MLECLKREDGGADFAGLAVPNEFDLTFIGEEAYDKLLPPLVAKIRQAVARSSSAAGNHR